MSKPRLLVTGGTGFLGQWVVPLLEEKYEVDLFSRSSAKGLRGDLTMWNAGLDEIEYRRGRYHGLLHMAGLYDLNASATNCYLNNVVGTGQALRLCRALDIPVFLNTSSVAAAINSRRPVVQPWDLDFRNPFPDPYAESKALAEQMIQNWSGMPARRVNMRPGVLVGDSRHGRIARVDGPYHAPAAFEKLRSLIEAFPGPLPLPGEDGRALPLVPVDAAARAIGTLVDLSLRDGKEGYDSYHLVPERGLAIRDFYHSVLEQRKIRHHGVVLVHQLPDVLLKKLARWLIQFPEREVTYLMSFPRYDTSNLTALIGTAWCPEFASYEKTFWSGYEAHVPHRGN